MATPLLLLYALLLFLVLCDDVEAYCYSYYDYYYSRYKYYCYPKHSSYSSYSTYSSSSFSPYGAIIGSVVGLIILSFGITVFCCCIRRRRQATTGRVIHNAGNMTVMSTNTVTGGYTSEFPQVLHSPYPQYSYPTQQTGPPSEYQPPPTLPQQTAPPSEYLPPPYYTVCQPPAYPGNNTSEKAGVS